MKSFLISCLLVLSCGMLYAEEMKFVTLLSQPVGSFSKVELLDTAKSADIFHLNFCNTGVTSGSITVSGTGTPVDVEKLLVRSSASLTGNLKTFSVSNSISVGSGANFTGGKLGADTAYVDKVSVDDGNGTSGEASLTVMQNLSLKTANFRTMDIANIAVMDSPAVATAKSSSLSWKKVSGTSSETAANTKAYLLTGTPSIVAGYNPDLKPGNGGVRPRN